MRARVRVLSGRLDEARQWAADHRASAADPTSYLDEYNALTLARLVVAEHRAGAKAAVGPDAALTLLNGVVEAAEFADRRGSLVEARMVRALASYGIR